MIGVSLRDVHFSYGSGPSVLKGVTLQAVAGEVLVLLGANGAGRPLVRASRFRTASIRLR